MKKTTAYIITGLLTATLLTACTSSTGNSSSSTTASSKTISAEQAVYSSNSSTNGLASSTQTDISDIFSNRDLKQTADTSDAYTIEVSDNKTYTISEEGVVEASV